MRIAIGSDHAGYKLKSKIIEFLETQPYEIIDCGTENADVSVDYPDYALDVANKVALNECPYGILVCGTGIGMSISANKVHGVRAALVWDKNTAELSREHNNANILCLGGRTTSEDLAISLVKVWLETEFAAGRHEKRIEKIAMIEKEA